MRIVHLIMTGGYSEGWSYQDSVLVKEHARDNEVSVITTQYERRKDTLVKVEDSFYVSPLGIRVYRLKHSWPVFPKKIRAILRKYNGIYDLLVQIKPDIVFSHNLQYFGTNEIARYVKENPKTRLYVDNHADFSNINKSWLSVNILHKFLWRHTARKLVPYTNMFWGVLPARVDFLTNIYKTPTNKTAYLPLGMELDKAVCAEEKAKEGVIRKKFNIKKEDFLIVTGGKIDRFKTQTLMLMEAVLKLELDVKLIVYGSVYDDIKETFFSLVDDKKVFYAGWIDSDETYDYIATADLVVYPGRHSVLWEQTVGQGRPMICKYWEGTTHIDIGGNVKFLYQDTIEEIYSVLYEVCTSEETYLEMLKAANRSERMKFSYCDIAKKSIELEGY